MLQTKRLRAFQGFRIKIPNSDTVSTESSTFTDKLSDLSNQSSGLEFKETRLSSVTQMD